MEENYIKFAPPRPSDEVINTYLETVKDYQRYCTEATLGNSPLKAGPIAAYLHYLLKNDMPYSVLKLQVDALSYFAAVQEVYDPTKHWLVQAVLRSAERSESERKVH